MKFSILVPVFNAAKYLKECIESVINQSYYNWELIIIDDGSTDDSYSILQQYALIDSRIIVHTQHNQGLIATRRSLISLSKSDYVIFLDSDDYLDLNLLDVISKYVSDYHADLIIYKYRKVEENGSLLNPNSLSFGEKNAIVIDDFGLILEQLITTTNLNNLVCKAVKRSLYIDDKTDYTSYYLLKHGEDLLQSIPILFSASKIVFINSEFYFYRQLINSMSNQVDFNKINDITIVRNVLLKYLERSEYNKPYYIRMFYNYYINNFFKQVLRIYAFSSGQVKKKLLNEAANNNLLISSMKHKINCSAFFKRWIIVHKIRLLFSITSIIYRILGDK